jgi:peptidoglycan hydrolase CwlO-like protein
MTRTLDVLELLESQHKEVDELLEQLESGKGDRAKLFAELADKLAAHATVEEKIDPRSNSDEFDAKLSVLKENVSHHAHEEEEDKLFPKLRKQMDADKRAALPCASVRMTVVANTIMVGASLMAGSNPARSQASAVHASTSS